MGAGGVQEASAQSCSPGVGCKAWALPAPPSLWHWLQRAGVLAEIAYRWEPGLGPGPSLDPRALGQALFPVASVSSSTPTSWGPPRRRGTSTRLHTTFLTNSWTLPAEEDRAHSLLEEPEQGPLQPVPRGGAPAPSPAPAMSSRGHLSQLCGTAPRGRPCWCLRCLDMASPCCQQSQAAVARRCHAPAICPHGPPPHPLTWAALPGTPGRGAAGGRQEPAVQPRGGLGHGSGGGSGRQSWRWARGGPPSRGRRRWGAPFLTSRGLEARTRGHSQPGFLTAGGLCPTDSSGPSRSRCPPAWGRGGRLEGLM